MKSVLIITGFCAMLISGSFVFADEGQTADKDSMMDQGAMKSQDQISNPKAVEVGNKICPVSGNKVGEMGEPIKYEYKGKIYNLCCPMCIKDFKNDPEKYSKIADDEVAKEKESK